MCDKPCYNIEIIFFALVILPYNFTKRNNAYMSNKTKRVKCSDESINSYGFWVKTKGIDLSQFLKNPVMFYNHERYNRMPIGRWENMKLEEDGSLTGEPIFDLNDPFAKQIADKFENNFLRAASIGIRILEESDVKEDIKPGQRLYTVSKCKLVEISICDIPSNDNALALYDENDQIINLSMPTTLLKTIKNTIQMTNLAKQFGLSETATETEMMAALQSLQNEKQNLSKKLEDLENEQKEKETARITSLVDKAIKDQKITADQKDLYTGIGKTSGAHVLEKALLSIKPIAPSSLLNQGGEGEKTDKSFLDHSQTELSELKETNKERYASLYKAHFGFAPSL